MELKVKLKNLMNGKGLNGQRLARLSQVSDSEISRILQGKSRPGLDNALRLAQALGVSLDYLADDKLDSEPPEPADSLSPEERKILGIIQKIGYPEVVTILENLRFLGYEVAMSRLVSGSQAGKRERKGSVRPPSPAHGHVRDIRSHQFGPGLISVSSSANVKIGCGCGYCICRSGSQNEGRRLIGGMLSGVEDRRALSTQDC